MKRFTLILLSVLILPTFLGNHNIYSSNVTINNSGNRTNLTAVENANEQEIANSNNDVFYEDEKIAVTSLTAGDFTVDGPSNGFSYASNVLTISSAGTYTISGVTITDIIVITASAEVILNNVDIKTSTRAPLEVQGNNAENASDNITATIKLKGENTLTPTGLNYAGLQLSNGANLILNGGEYVGSLFVDASEGNDSAGIGGGNGGIAGNITIIDGLINTYGGNMPGAIGVPEDQLRKAASMAVCKINIDSDLRLAMTATIRKYFNDHPDHFDPRQYLKPARAAIKAMVAHKITDVLGCDGKA